MRYILIFITFISLNVYAKEWKTDSFTINLPDSFIVETDKKSRLLAFSKNGRSSPLFLSIEFGEKFQVNEVKKRINESINVALAKEECKPKCKAYFYESSQNIDGQTIFTYHYLVTAKSLSFVISYIDNSSLEEGRNFVKQLGQQIRKNSI